MSTHTADRANVNAWIDVRHRERLAELARENDRSISAELRRAIAAHVEREGVSSGKRRVSETMPAAGVR